MKTAIESSVKSSDKSPTEVLDSLNMDFLVDHHVAGKHKLNKVKHVFVNLCGKVSVWTNSQNRFEKTHEAVIPSSTGLYTRTKQVSHLSVLMIQTVKHFKEQDLNIDTFKAKLQAIKNGVVIVLTNLDTIFSHQYVETQRQILTHINDTLEVMISTGNLDNISSLLKTLLTNIDPYLKQNMTYGAQGIISELDEQIQQWGLNRAEVFESARAIVVGPHGPRNGEPMSQYFINKFNQYIPGSERMKIEDSYFYYVETMPRLMSEIDILDDLILNFLAISEFNKDVGKKVFGDSSALFFDILKKDAARAIVHVSQKKDDSMTHCPLGHK